jgi:hypothetical protein
MYPQPSGYRNVGYFLPDYTASHPEIRSSLSPPRETPTLRGAVEHRVSELISRKGGKGNRKFT